MTAPDQIVLRDAETIAFLGDSITQQNLYTAFIETFLTSRFPGKDLRFYNFGWGGDTAPGGAGRYARDVAPVKPDLVLVKFGMNDGGYTGPDEAIRARYLAGQEQLADAVAASGARQVLISPNAVDPHGFHHLQQYNPSLRLFAEHLAAIAQRRGIPFIDFFTPFLAVQAKAKAADPAFTMIPDGVHPLEVGHLVMAYQAMRRFGAPAGLGDLTVTAEDARSNGPATVSNIERGRRSLSFDLHLPFLPFFVPEAARGALALVPLQQELNRFRLDCPGWSRTRALEVRIDGVEVAIIAPGASAPLDLALLDQAPWSHRGRLLWLLAQTRFTTHFQAWRDANVSAAAGVASLPGREAITAPMNEMVRTLGQELRRLAAPATYRVTVAESTAVSIGAAEVSPIYPFTPNDTASFEQAHPPETAPGTIAWKTAAMTGYHLDLGALFGGPTNCVSYLRVVLESAAVCRVRLTLGSDDGITVFLDGKQVLARDVYRGCRLGDDRIELTLPTGRSTLLLRVTQGGGGYAVAFRADVLDDVDVRQVPPA